MGIFDFDEYKLFLKKYLQSAGRRGLLSELAQAIGCSHSLLSQVINGKPDISLDQAYGIAQYLGFKENETEYFLLLVQASRATTLLYRTKLKEKISKLRDEHHRVKIVVQSSSKNIDPSRAENYFMSIKPSMVHILTGCPEYQKADRIAARLGLSLQQVEQHLQFLVENQFVKRSKSGEYTYLGGNTHLPEESPLTRANHFNWRVHAMGQLGDSKNIHYTSNFSLSRKDWEVLRSDLLEFIENQRKKISASPSEEVYVFCCDLFRG